MKENPKQIKVTAISQEKSEKLSAVLHAKGTTLSQFNYNRLPKSLTQEHAYASRVAYLPYVFVISSNILVWEGNPTYPKGLFEDIMHDVLAGRALPSAEAPKFRRLRQEINELAKQKIALMTQLKEANTELKKKGTPVNKESTCHLLEL